MSTSDGLHAMELNYNSGEAWHYNVYNPGSSAHYYSRPATEGFVLNNAAASHVLDSNWQQTGSDTREEHSVKYSASLKVLNPTNKDFTMFTLRNLTAEDMNTPASLKEFIFEVGECCL